MQRLLERITFVYCLHRPGLLHKSGTPEGQPRLFRMLSANKEIPKLVRFLEPASAPGKEITPSKLTLLTGLDRQLCGQV
jgi:hypothetical protein